MSCGCQKRRARHRTEYLSASDRLSSTSLQSSIQPDHDKRSFCQMKRRHGFSCYKDLQISSTADYCNEQSPSGSCMEVFVVPQMHAIGTWDIITPPRICLRTTRGAGALRVYAIKSPDNQRHGSNQSILSPPHVINDAALQKRPKIDCTTPRS